MQSTKWHGRVTPPVKPAASAAKLMIGHNPLQSTYFDGLIDELRIYGVAQPGPSRGRPGRGGLAMRAMLILVGSLFALSMYSSIAVGAISDPHDVRRDGSALNANFDNDGVDDYRVDADIAILHKGGWTGVNPGFNLVHEVDCVNPNPWRQSQGLYTPPDPEDPDWWSDEHLNGPGEDDHGCLENAGEPLNGFTINAARGTEVDGTNGHGGVAPGVRIWAVKVIEDHSINFGEYPDPDNYPLTISGTGLGPVSSPALPVACGQNRFEAQLISNMTFSLALDAEYGACSSGARTAAVEMQSCHYTLEVENAGPPYAGTWGVACEEPEDAIEVKLYNGQLLVCTATIGAQQGVVGADLTNLGAGVGRSIEIDAQAEDFEYALAGSACGTPTGAFDDGELVGKTTLSGANDSEEPRGFFLNGKSSEVTSEKPNFNGEIGWLPALGTAHLIAGLDWVAAHADQIDVAYLQIACAREGLVAEYPLRYEGTPECDDVALNEAIDRAIEKGVVVVAGAGNEGLDTGTIVPQANPDVFTASAVIDTDGLPGALGPNCSIFQDDQRLSLSNFGLLADISAPLCGDTGGASSKVAAAAAALASQCDPQDREGVEFIVDTVMAEGHVGEIAEGGWKDDSGDGWKEPLLDLSDEDVFDPVLLHTSNPALDEEPSPDGCQWKSRAADDDVDGDGRSDLVAVSADGTPHVFGGEENGLSVNAAVSLSGQLDPALGDATGHYVVDMADVTGDGHSDLISIEHDGGSFVHPGKADGTFGAGVESFSASAPVHSGLGSSEPIAVADVTGDGFADSVSFSHQTKVIYMAPGKVSGKFGETFGEGLTSSVGGLDSALLDGTGHYFLDAADVTGDGRADLVSMNSNGTAYVFRAQANNTFAAGVSAASIDPILDNGTGVEPVGLGDVDRDRRADLLTLESGTLKLRLGKSDGTFAAATTAYGSSIDSSLLDGTGEELLGLLDYSRDGLADLLTVSDKGTLRTYTAQRDRTFAAPSAYGASLPSVRHSPGGHEFLAESPLLRRAGCRASGCQWRPAPIAAYSFDEGMGSTLHDSAGSHDGTVSGAAWSTAGKYGSALNFDGVNDLASVADSSELDFTGPFTIEAWVRPDTLAAWSPLAVKAENTASGFPAGYWTSAQATLNPGGSFGNGSTGTSGAFAKSPLPTGAWSHVARTYDGTSVRFYVNGALADSGPASVKPAASAAALAIGHNPLKATYFDGLIDELRLYRVALSQAQVEADRDRRVGFDPAPVAAYSFEEGSGSVLGDSAGSHDGTVSGAAWSTAGKYGSALDFDGVNDLASVADANELDPTAAFTIEAWVRPDTLGTWSPLAVKAENTASGWPAGYWISSQSILNPAGSFGNGTTGTSGVFSTSPLPTAAWSHLAITYDGTSLKLYENGTLKKSVTPPVKPAASAAKLMIGHNPLQSTYFDGLIDELRLYRVALSQAQVEADRDAGV